MELADTINSYAYEVVNRARLACNNWIGKLDCIAADFAATEAMRSYLNELEIDGIIRIGEGERDGAPMLYIGEKIGKGGIKLDIAVDPLEGTNMCAQNLPGALCVIAIAKADSLLMAPDVYMYKFITGYKVPKIDLEADFIYNLSLVAQHKGCRLKELRVCMLNRPRHQHMIREIHDAGINLSLIEDGDILAALECTSSKATIDVYCGIGGAPEGVLAAAALKNLKGSLYGKLHFNDEASKHRALDMGVKIHHTYCIEDIIQDQDVVFAASAVTNNTLMKAGQTLIISKHGIKIYD